MNWSAIGAVALGLGVAIGAFGAHGLQDRLDAYSLMVYEKGVFYHFVHALGLLIVSFLPRIGALSRSAANWVCGLLAFGIVAFSGSLYALAVSGNRMLGIITPIGGTAFIAAWVVLAISLSRARRHANGAAEASTSDEATQLSQTRR
jgi:uncharacterized membrane protein YgdD (TMEM256/DUF423 family)